MIRVDPKSRLYLITDEASSRGRSNMDIVQWAAAGGVGMVQYRCKGKTTCQMVEEAGELLQVCRRAGIPLVINDRADIALAVTAEGVHVGGEDLPVALARRLMGPGAIVGATVRGVSDAREAQRQGASYVAIGPVFASPSSPGMAAVGLEGVAEIVRAVSIPVCAFGGITAENITSVAASPARLIAVLSAVTSAEDPQSATKALMKALQG